MIKRADCYREANALQPSYEISPCQRPYSLSFYIVQFLKSAFNILKRRNISLFSLHGSFQGVFDINHKPVLDIALYQPLKSFICWLNWNHFYVGMNSVRSTEVNHFLCLLRASSCTTRNGYPTCQEAKHRVVCTISSSSYKNMNFQVTRS